MKNNRIPIIIIGILILIMILQNVYFSNRIRNANKESELARKNTTNYQSTNQTMKIGNIIELYKNYDGDLSQSDIESIIYTIINININEIKNTVRGKNPAENQTYYEEHKAQINQLGVYSKEEFVLIAEEVNNVFREEYINLTSAEISIIDNDESDQQYYSFLLTINYSNASNINLKCRMAKEKENRIKIICYSNSSIAQVYERYNVSTNKNDFITVLNNFISSMKQIHNDTRMKSLNNQAQYYSLNITKLNQIGIQSDKDFKSIAYEINTNISWNEQMEFSYYTIDLESLKEENGYVTFKMLFNFEHTEMFVLNFGLALNSSLPRVKIYGQNGDL